MTDTTPADTVLRAVYQHAQAALDDDRGDQHQALEDVRDMAQAALSRQGGDVSPTEAASLGAWLRALPDGTVLLGGPHTRAWQARTGYSHADDADRWFPSLQMAGGDEPFDIADCDDLAALAEWAPFTVLWRPDSGRPHSAHWVGPGPRVTTLCPAGMLPPDVFAAREADVTCPACAQLLAAAPPVAVHAFPPVDNRSSTRPYRSGSDPQPRCGAHSDRMAVFAADVTCPNCLTVMREQDAAAALAVPSCGACAVPFDPADTRFDGHARHGETSWCRSCIDRCHEGDADHRCPICRDGGPR